MEAVQYIQHRVVDGTYRATLYWKVENSKVYIKEGDEWLETKVPVVFIKDYETTPNLKRGLE